MARRCAYWGAIAERYDLDLTVTNDKVDPQFGFMTADWDGKIRMDPSSPHAMARLVALRDEFDIALGNDADADRHGVVTPTAGLLNPNHFLSAAIAYLFGGARGWGAEVAVGKTLVSSSMIDLVAADLDRRLIEVPVGFKWFVDGLVDGSLGFGGEESAGASFLRRDGTVWTTDKDGIIADLLACELTAQTGRDPGEAYRELTERFGVSPVYRRIDARATPAEKAALGRLTPDAVTAATLAGDPVTAVLTEAPGNGAPDRGPEGHDRARLVRRPAVRNRGRLQGLRRELPRRGAPRDAHRGGAGPGLGDGGWRRLTAGQLRLLSGIRAPFTAAASSEARNRNVAAISFGAVHEAFFGSVSRTPFSSIALTMTRFTVTPVPPTSRASVRSSTSWAALPIAYGAIFAGGSVATGGETASTRPQPRSTIPGITAWARCSVVHRCWSSIPAMSAGSSSAIGVPAA